MVCNAVGQRDGGHYAIRLSPFCDEEHVACCTAEVRQEHRAVVEELELSRLEFDSRGGTKRSKGNVWKIEIFAESVSWRCPDLGAR